MRNRTIIALSAFLSLFGCTTEPQTSYCEAVCDWAVGCAEGERTVDAAALLTECIAATEAVDGSCADAGKGELNAVDATALTECTDAIAAQQDGGECDAFTGRIDDQKQATTPAACATQGGATAQDTFDAARLAVAETNDELCERFSHNMCEKTDECVRAQLGETAEELIAVVGVDPYDNCRSKVESTYNECVTNSDYAPEEDLTDVNTLRQGARECLADFDSVTCEQMFSGDMPPLCAAAVADPTAYAGAITGTLTDYVDAGTE